MRIGIDSRSLAEAQPTGIPAAKQALLESLVSVGTNDVFCLWFNAAARTLPEKLRSLATKPNVELHTSRWPNKLVNGAIAVSRRPRLDKLLGGVDICLVPDLHFVAVSDGCPIVTVVHDLSFVRSPEYLNWRKRVWHNVVRPLETIQRSDQVIAVSEATRRELLDRDPNLDSKIKVIHHGFATEAFRDVSTEALQRVGQQYQLPATYFIIMATNEPRKNLQGLIAAFMKLKQARPDAPDLVLAGPPGWRHEWLGTVDPLLARSIHRLGYVPRIDVPALYQLSLAGIFPSFGEGFGFPPLECLAAGRPVIIAQRGALPEVTNRGAVMVDPANEYDILQAMERMMTDEPLRRRLAEAGRPVIDQFSWTGCAQQVLDVLHETGGR